jgi:site-specific DNA recombinase
MSVLGKPVVRAAVYTRKSSDEGLDQEFNSLDAQHEACSAYIASQRHEGWKKFRGSNTVNVTKCYRYL